VVLPAALVEAGAPERIGGRPIPDSG
jgi:hypothetical protein